MTTIILTIIGILLAAAAALMVIFYGGDAFNSGTVGAQANQYQNAGTNVVSAVQMFKAEFGVAPTVITDLTVTGASRPNGPFLDELPALPSGMTASLTTGTGNVRYYQVVGVPGNVCVRINANLRNPSILSGTPVANANPKMGCIPGTNPANDPGTFYARA